jgi:hypothetical protein
MKTEELTALGLTEEQASKVFEMHGKELTKLQGTVSTLTTERDGLKTQLGEANTKLTGYDPDWKTKATEAERLANEKVTKIQFDNALTAALSAAKAKNPVAVRALLDLNGLKQNGDAIVGLEEQLTKIKKEADYLFETDKKPPRFAGPTPGADKNPAPGKNDEVNSAFRAAFGRSENNS